jgi:putative transposase
VAGRRPGRHVLDILVQPRRDAKAAKRFFRNLPTKHCQVPRVLVTDKLRSYQAAHRAVMPSVKHRQSRYLNNPGGELAPADPPTRTRTRHETIPHPRLSPTVPGGVQRDLPAFPARRHRLTADDYRTAMTDRFATWNDITRSSKAA